MTEEDLRKIVREEMRSYSSGDFSEPQDVSNAQLSAMLDGADLQNVGRGGGDRQAKLSFRTPEGHKLEVFVDTANLYRYTG